MSSDEGTAINQPSLAPGQLHGGSWRPRRGMLWLTSRAMRRAIASVAVLSLVSFLGYLLAQPFWHPRTSLLLLAPADELSLEATSTRNVAAQAQAWQTIETSLDGPSGKRITSLPLETIVTAPERLTNLINASGHGDKRVVILSLSAQAVEKNRQAVLLTRNARLESPPPGTLPFSELLNGIKQTRPGTKLLIADLGDAREGLVSGEVSQRIGEAVAATDDPTLWVLASHSNHEVSHSSALLGQNVFGYFVVRGLEGAADRDRSGAVEVGELYEYVRGNVMAWVAQESAGAATQQPVLYWGGGDIADSRPTLILPVNKRRSAGLVASFTQIVSTRRAQQSEQPTPFARVAAEQQAAVVSQATNSIASASRALTPAPLVRAVDRTSSLVAKARGAGLPTKPPTATTAPAPAATSTTTDEKSAGPSASEEAAKLLTQGWLLRDELAARTRFDVSPVDFAPQLWREYEMLLLAAERQLRYGDVATADEIVARLRRDILPLTTLYDPALPSPEDPQTIAERIAAALPRDSHLPANVPSLGMAEVSAELSGASLPAEYQSVSASFAKWVASPNEAQLDAWLAEEATKNASSLREVQLATRLRQSPEIEFSIATRLLIARYAMERLAAQPQAASPWLREQVLESDRWLTETERCVFDRVRSDWRDNAQRLLEQIGIRIAELNDKVAQLGVVERLQADLFYRAPQYVQLHAFAISSGDLENTHHAEVLALLTGLQRLQKLATDPGTEKWDEYVAASADVAARGQRIEALWQAGQLRKSLDAAPQPGEIWLWERLLSTTLVDGASRVRMLAVLPEREAQLAQRFLEADAWQRKTSTDGFVTPSTERDARYLALARELTLLGATGTVDSAVLAEVQSLQSTNDRLGRALSSANREMLTVVEQSLESADRLRFAADRPVALARLRSALCIGRLIDVRDAVRLRWPSLGNLIHRSEAFNVFELGYERALAAGRGARPGEAAYHDALADQYRDLASRLPGQPGLGEPQTSAVLATVAETGSLMEAAAVDLPMRVASQRSYDVPVWLALDYDPASLQVQLIGADRFTDLSKLADVDAPEANAFRQGTAVPDSLPSFTLAPGSSQDLRLRVKRSSLPEFPAKIVVHMVTREGAVRHTSEIELPTRPRMQLVVRGVSGTSATSEHQVRLQPFANRQSTYEVDLASLVDQPLKGSVRLYVPRLRVTDLPPGGVPSATADRLLARVGAGKPWGEAMKLTLDRNETAIPLKFMPPKPDENEPPASAVDPAAPPAPKDAPIALPFGLIAAISDETLQRVVLVHLPTMPQRPRRFLRATAGYNQRRERVELRISALDPALLPADGVKVTADFGDVLAAGAQARTNDVVLGAGEVLLTGEVPAQGGRTVTVHVAVDDYPRAFSFEIPCSGDSSGIAPLDRVALAIQRLPQGKSYRAPAASMPVDLRVDLPSSVQLDTADRLEVGIDERADRELTGDPVLRLLSDRQADVTLAPLGDDGLLQITTRVDDLKVEVPTAGLQNITANVLVRAVVSDREYFSKPVEVTLDSAAPHYELPQLSPSRTVNPETELTLSMLMIDEGQSGIEKVEVAVDSVGAGIFSDKVAPVAATLNKSGRYEAKLPTTGLAPGNYTILIRASDRVGNVSDFLPLKGLVIAATGAEGGDTTNTVTGVVQFGRRNLEGFEVTLTSEPPVALPPVMTDAAGKFVFKKVPPGKYKVAARGVVRNKVSNGEAEVTVKALPAVVAPLELQVR